MRAKRAIARAIPILLLTLVLLMALTGCTSAVAPGGQDVLDQADKAREVQVEATLRMAAAAEQAYNAENGTFTTSVPDLQTRYGLNIGSGVTITIPRADATTYCIQAHQASLGDYHLANTDAMMVKGPC